MRSRVDYRSDITRLLRIPTDTPSREVIRVLKDSAPLIERLKDSLRQLKVPRKHPLHQRILRAESLAALVSD